MIAAPPAVRAISVVHVHICLETTQPPAGIVVTCEGEPAQPFAGWLQLMTVLADAFQWPPAAPLTHRTATAP